MQQQVQIPLSLYTALLQHQTMAAAVSSLTTGSATNLDMTSSSTTAAATTITTLPRLAFGNAAATTSFMQPPLLNRTHDQQYIYRHSFTQQQTVPMLELKEQKPLQQHQNQKAFVPSALPSDLASLTAMAASTAAETLTDLSKSKAEFVDSLVGTATQIIESIWPTSAAANCSPQSRLVPLRRFIQEILKRSRTSFCTLQLALLYIIRLRNQMQKSPAVAASPSSSSAKLPPSSCGRRMFLASLIVAAKYVQDRNYSNRAWAKISGLSLSEINANEQELLRIIDWDLFVSHATYVSWSTMLLAKAAQVRKEQEACGVKVDTDAPSAAAVTSPVAAPSKSFHLPLEARVGVFSGNSVELMTPPHERSDSFAASSPSASFTSAESTQQQATSIAAVAAAPLSMLSTLLSMKAATSNPTLLESSAGYPSPQSDLCDQLQGPQRGQKRAREEDCLSPVSATLSSEEGFSRPWMEVLEYDQNKRIRV